MGTSDDDIKRLQLKESEWAYEWFDNDLFAAEQPQHRVFLPAFEIGQFPVTNADYHIFTWDAGYRLPRSWKGFSFPDDMENHPVVGVSKVDADNYIKWLNEKTGMNYHLPTEAQWERAARGDDGRIFPWGNTFDPWRCNTAESVKKRDDARRLLFAGWRQPMRCGGHGGECLGVDLLSVFAVPLCTEQRQGRGKNQSPVCRAGRARGTIRASSHAAQPAKAS